MAKRLVVKRTSAKAQNTQIKETSSKRAAWYVIAGRILWLLVVPVMPAAFLTLVFVVLYGLTAEFVSSHVNLSLINFIKCVLNHPIAIGIVLYIVVLFFWLHEFVNRLMTEDDRNT